MHPIAHPRGGGGGGGGRSTGRGGRGGEGPSVVVQTDRLGVGIGGGRHDHREVREENDILFSYQHQEEASVGSQADCI